MKRKTASVSFGSASGGRTHVALDLVTDVDTLQAHWEVSTGWGRGRRVKYQGVSRIRAEDLYRQLMIKNGYRHMM